MTTERVPLHVAFADFWPGFDPADNFWTRVLSDRYELIPSLEPDVVLCSMFGTSFRSFDCVRVLVNWENHGWSFTDYDYAFTSDIVDDPRHHRLPNWVARLARPYEMVSVDGAASLAAKRGFASMVVSAPSGTSRNRMFDLLSAYRPIASGGRYRNNVGGPVADKRRFIRDYKFHLAYENSSYPGYTTEKLLHGLQADTVPIYWGDPLVAVDFNARRFINVADFASERAAIDRVIELNHDDVQFEAMLEQPWFVDGLLPPVAELAPVINQFDRIVTTPITPVSRQPQRLLQMQRARDAIAANRRLRDRIC